MISFIVQELFDLLHWYLMRTVLKNRHSKFKISENESLNNSSSIIYDSNEHIPLDESDEIREIKIQYLEKEKRKIHNISLKASSLFKVKELKQLLSTKLDKNMSNIAIVFMGRQLSDELDLNDCDIGNQSLLHAFEIQNILEACDKSSKTIGSSSKDKNVKMDEQTPMKTSETILETLPRTEDILKPKNHFYIYCHDCRQVRFGKLRVCCLYCRQTSVICDRGPQDWNDVLKPERIRAFCYNSNCVGVETKILHTTSYSTKTWALFFFKCINENEHHIESNEIVGTIPLDRIRFNFIRIECLACLQTDQDHVLVFSCGHVLCLQCWPEYIKSCIQQRTRLIFIKTDNSEYFSTGCPIGCSNSSVERSYFRFLNDQTWMLYEKIEHERKVLSNNGVFCPYPDCGKEHYPKKDEKDFCQITSCDQCQLAWCIRCNSQGLLGSISQCLVEKQVLELNNQKSSTQAIDDQKQSNQNATSGSSQLSKENNLWSFFHFGFGKQNEKQSQKNNRWEDKASKMILRQIAKPCPQCRIPIERSGGCMHMTCTDCNYEWCWLCECQWNASCIEQHWFFNI